MKNSYITATDQFCGAGGSTSGAKLAGVEVKMALNHWGLVAKKLNMENLSWQELKKKTEDLRKEHYNKT